MGDKIVFAFNLSHNASASTKNPVKSIKITLNSKFLKPESGSFVTVGSVPIDGSVTYPTSTSAVLQVADLASGQEFAIKFSSIVQSTIHPLANLYFTADITGDDIGGTNQYPSGPHPSTPTLYAVFPKVTLQRTSMAGRALNKMFRYKKTK